MLRVLLARSKILWSVLRSNTYCSDCIKNSSCPFCGSEKFLPPPKLILRMLEKISVTCSNCSALVKLGDFPSHKLIHVPVSCTAVNVGCTFKGIPEFMEKHTKECAYFKLKDRLEEKDKKIDELTKKMEEKDKRINESNKQVSKMEEKDKRIDELTKKVSKMEEKDKRINELTKKVSKMEEKDKKINELTKKVSKMEEKDKRIDELTKQISKMEETIDSLTNENVHLNGELEELQEEVFAKTNELEELQEEVEENTKRLCEHDDCEKLKGNGGLCEECEQELNRFYFVCNDCNSCLCTNCHK